MMSLEKMDFAAGLDFNFWLFSGSAALSFLQAVAIDLKIIATNLIEFRNIKQRWDTSEFDMQ